MKPQLMYEYYNMLGLRMSHDAVFCAENSDFTLVQFGQRTPENCAEVGAPT